VKAERLEVGTSNGYSAIWLGDAAQATGGRGLSLDIEPERTAVAAEHLAAAGVADVVDLRTEDAATALARFDDAGFDLVFLDAERPAYVGYWPDLVRALARPGLLAVDNVLSHADQVAEFRALVEADARVTSSVAPIGAWRAAGGDYRRDQGVSGRSDRTPSTTMSTRSLKKAMRPVTSAASRSGSR
jgi:predicted O-methyltransferase YrrM